MRVIEVEAESKGDRWLLWLLAGAAVGVTAGVVLADRYSGRTPSLKALRRRLRGLASLAGKQWGPLVDVALELKDQWDERRAARATPAGRGADLDDALDDERDDERDDDLDVELDEYLDEDLEDADEYAEAEAPLDDDLGDDFPDEELDEADEDQIGERVLEAFANDPILAERAVEIEADDDGDVILYGRVRSAREVTHAVTLARGVPGVTRVRQQLQVRPRR
jgi:hypothetical protein